MYSLFQKSTLVLALLGTLASSQLMAQCPNSRPIYRQPIQVQPIYSQPVYSQPVYGTPVYGQPVISSPQPVRTLTSAEAARMYTTDAKTLFKNGKYQAAMKKLDQVIQRVPKDANAFQFRSLAAFAAANFESAAADAYDSLGLGNAWTRPVIQSLYGQDLKQYQTHLANLKRTANAKPTMPAHFLLAYHHLMNEQWAEGKLHLQKVLELQANEPLSTKLLAVVDQKLAGNR